MNSNDLGAILPRVTDHVLQVQRQNGDAPTIPLAPLTSIPSTLPRQGLGVADTFDLFKQTIAPGLSSSSGPRYFGFITGGVTPAAFIGDVLATAYDQNVMTAAAAAGSCSADVEAAVMKMLADLLRLPSEFDGVLTTGGTASNTVALACARQWIGEHYQGVDVANDGIQALKGRILVFGTMAHQSISKAMGILGLGRKVQHVQCDEGRPARMCPKDLDRLLSAAKQDENAAGCIVIAQAGEVNTSDCDDLISVASVCRKHGAWLHVDGAANLLARVSDRYGHLLSGLELADSITGDAHKWLNVPYDCGIFFTRHSTVHEAAFGASASYLGISTGFAPINRGIENSRRFRALPLWMSLQAYGREGFQQLVERTCLFAQRLGNWIEASSQYSLLEPVRLNTILFRANDCDSEQAHCVLAAINKTSKVFVTPTVWRGEPAIRASIANWNTGERDLTITIEALIEGYQSTIG